MIERRIALWQHSSPDSRRIAKIPGVGVLTRSKAPLEWALCLATQRAPNAVTVAMANKDGANHLGPAGP